MKRKFPVFQKHPDLIYFDSAATTHKPKVVIDALTKFYAEDYGTVHRAIYQSSLKATEQYHATRETAQAFLNAKEVDEIIFTKGTTDALNLVAQSFGSFLTPGDEILVTQMEHHSNIVPWQMIAQKTGATLRFIPSDLLGVLQWEGCITKNTKIVAVAHMSNVTGTIHPIRQMADAAHFVGAVIVIDGAQAAPHIPIDVRSLDADFYAFSGHKCYGPTGVGILYGKKELLQKMPPVQGGGDMIERVEMGRSTYQEPPLRFEAGTPNIADVIALKSALDFIQEVGKEQICAHENKLFNQVMQGLPKVRILGEVFDKGPIITFVVPGKHPLDIATFLDLKKIAVRSGHLCAQPILRFFGVESALRISFGIYNTEEDVKSLLQGLQEALSYR